jgi:SNF2 family DNA or RNA helicase
MVSVEKLDKGTYFKDAFKISFKYDPTTVARIKELSERRYLPEDRAWEIPAHELPNLVEKLGIHNINSNSGVMDALKTKEIEDKREATQERLRGIKPIVDFDFTTTPLPHQIEAFNYGMERDELLIGDEQGLGKTKESIDITVARKKDLCKCLIVCGVNSVKYNWEAEIKTHSKEKSVMLDQKTMPLRVKALNEWLRGSEYYAIINIESLRNEAIQDAIYLGIKDGFIGCIIVDEIHKAKNGSSQQGKALRMLRSPVKIGLSGTPMNKAEDLWNILTWLGIEKRSFYSFRNAYCIMGGYGGYKVVGHKNLESLNAELNKVMIRRKKEEVLDLPPKIHSTEYVELTAKQQKLYKDIKQGIIEDMENILASLNPLSCTLRLRQLTGGMFTEDNAKLERIADMLAEEIIPNGYKAIIFSQWEQVASLYNEALQEYNPVYIVGKVSPEDRQKAVERFQTDPNCKLAIGTIGAMGTGLTLNKASYVFFIDKLWNSGENAQAEDRAHRIGTAGTVNIISMVAKGSVDEGVEEYLLENKDLFDRVVDGKGSKTDIQTILYKLLRI